METFLFVVATLFAILEIFMLQQILYKKDFGSLRDSTIHAMVNNGWHIVSYVAVGVVCGAVFFYWGGDNAGIMYVLSTSVQMLSLWIRFSQLEEIKDGYTD